MRLRLVLHRRRRGRGLGGLRPAGRRAALAGALLIAITTLAACSRTASVEQRSTPAQGSGRLTIGISELNPSFFWSETARPNLTPPFGPFRNLLVSLQPRYYRLYLDWASYQPPGAPLNLAGRRSGCIRDIPPCAPYAGVREELEAVRSAQREYGGFQVMVVPYATPAALAAKPTGCEPPATSPAAYPPADLNAYRAFIRAVLQTAREVGVDIRYWSAWNEPNHPAFLNPQRATCDTAAAPLSPAVYAGLVGALEQELDAAPGDQEIVMGELAGYDAPRPTALSVKEFTDALPADVVCRARIWGQHAYVGQSGPSRAADFAGDADLDAARGLLATLERSLDAKRCSRPLRVWITETGVGGERAGRPRSLEPAALAAGCEAMNDALRSWYADPRVDVAFQYTFREADTFPVGLVDTQLTRAFPTYDLWAAWGGTRAPDAPAPPLPAGCR